MQWTDIQSSPFRMRMSSNKPLEWTGLNQIVASPPQDPCLPLRGSVRPQEIGESVLVVVIGLVDEPTQ